MKTVVIANPRAANGTVGRHWHRHKQAIVDHFGTVEVRLTGGPGQATDLTRRSLQEGFERVVVAGGDGTINEAVNGFFDAEGKATNPDASLALFSAGTGGDFARSVGLAGRDASRALAQATDKRVDVGRATLTAPDGRERVRFFINISSFGSSGLIVDMVNCSSKIMGGKASFMLGTIKGLLRYRNQRVRLTVDDRFDDEMVINTVAVANGRYFGGSMMVAPNALLDDGEFDIVVIGDVGVGAFVRHSSRIYQGTHLSIPGFSELRGKRVTATPLGEDDVLIELDGEQPGRLPVRYDILPAAVWVYAPWGNAEGAGQAISL